MYQYVVIANNCDLFSQHILDGFHSCSESNFTLSACYSSVNEFLHALPSMRVDVVFLHWQTHDTEIIPSIYKARTMGFEGLFIAMHDCPDFSFLQMLLRENIFDCIHLSWQKEEWCAVHKHLQTHFMKHHLENQQRMHELFLDVDTVLELPDEFETSMHTHWIVAILVLTDPIAFENCLPTSLSYSLIHTKEDQLVLIAGGDSELQGKVCEQLLTYYEHHAGYAGLSNIANSLSSKNQMLHEAHGALCQRFLYPELRLLLNNVGNRDAMQILFRKLLQALYQHDSTVFYQLLDQAPQYLCREQTSIQDVVCLWNQLVLILHERCNEPHVLERAEFLRVPTLMARFPDVTALCKCLIQLFMTTWKLWSPWSNDTHINEQFLTLLSYVTVHYEEPLSLRALAFQHHLNFSYCCDLFKRTTGMTFSNYLIKLRMGKASLLLQSSELVPQDIYKMVGYKDLYYFTRSYKKYILGESNLLRNKA